MPRLACGLATRTHGVRPSEKTGPNVIPGFPRKAIPARMTNPPEGRAPHARKERHRGEHNIAPSFGQGPSLNAPVGNATPCHLHGRTMRTRRPRPSEKTTSRAFWRAVGKPWVTITCMGTCLA